MTEPARSSTSGFYTPRRAGSAAGASTSVDPKRGDFLAVALGGQFEVRLRNDPPAAWIDPPVSPRLRLLRRRVEQNFPGQEVMTGDYGSTIWTYQGVAAGEAVLTFRALRDRGGEVLREVERRVAIGGSWRQANDAIDSVAARESVANEPLAELFHYNRWAR